MKKEAANINVNLELKINGMPIDEFQKEIEKLSSLLEEIKQFSVLRDEENTTSNEINDTHITNLPYIEALRQQARKDEGI